MKWWVVLHVGGRPVRPKGLNIDGEDSGMIIFEKKSAALEACLQLKTTHRTAAITIPLDDYNPN